MISERQFQRFMKYMSKHHGVLRRAANAAGIHRQTAAAYLQSGLSPKERKSQAPPRGRTRPDPLAGGLWERALTWFEPTPELDAKALFEHLLGERPEWVATAGPALRTFQRRAKQWRELYGPPKEIYFPQVRAPGVFAQFDWTRVREDDYLVTINGVAFEHLLTHLVLPYSNWQWALPCLSESSLSLRRGVQGGFWRLGGVTPNLQTDCSSAATHQIEREDQARAFNEDYLEFCRYLKTEPRTIHVASPDENGDVEAANRHLKRRIRNHLILRGSFDFPCEADYAAFVAQICDKANALRAGKVNEELALLKALPARRYPETQEVTALVTRKGTISVNKVPYTVPSRLVGTTLSVQVGERDLTFVHGSTIVLQRAKATPENPSINYRHLIDWLLKKSGAFAQYQYRESLFPDICFRQAHEALTAHEEARADKRYLQLLKLAADGSETAVSEAIGACLRENIVPLPERIEKRLARKAQRARSILERVKPLEPSLREYATFAKAVCP
jgi:hypothetical protein